MSTNQKLETGGPAFPQTETARGNPMANEYGAECGGMTLRDYFAGQALQGLLASMSNGDMATILNQIASEEKLNVCEVVAQNSYNMATAMLLQRKK